MVRVDVGGQNLININTAAPGTIAEAKQNIRRQLRGKGTGSSLNFNSNWTTTKPRLILTSDTTDFDTTITSHFESEGFQTTYLEYTGNQKAYSTALQHLSDGLELGDRYAIVAYGDAATPVLSTCIRPMAKLAAVIAYYPPHMPPTSTGFPLSLLLQIHIAGSQKWGTTSPSFRYEDTIPGFAEHDLEEYDSTAATMAWSRTLGLLRRAFDIHVDLEAVWDNHTRLEFETKDAAATMATMVKEPYVNHVPTMTGGIGAKDLHRFYKDFFIPGNPPSLKIKILSRTVGVDRVVDEMLCTFRHTEMMHWMLPGVPPTDKEVEVVLVGVICIRGGKLYHEHIHWDQATVLVQVGLLDLKLVPAGFKTAERGREKELKQLPVVGREGARKVVDKDDGASNGLITGWHEQIKSKGVDMAHRSGKGKERQPDVEEIVSGEEEEEE